MKRFFWRLTYTLVYKKHGLRFSWGWVSSDSSCDDNKNEPPIDSAHEDLTYWFED